MRMRTGEKTVTAVMGQDGRVYFEFQRVAKRARLPISLRIPDWMSVSLSLLVAAVVVTTVLLI